MPIGKLRSRFPIGLRVELAAASRTYETNPSLTSAIHLVQAAHAAGDFLIARNAAVSIRQLLAPHANPPNFTGADQMSLDYLRMSEESTFEDSPEQLPTPESLRAAISSTRRELNQRPRQPLAWLELARLYFVALEPAKAEKALSISLGLAPQSRLICRSASRFYWHQGDPERAQAVLRSSAASDSDPWLLAADLAITSLSGGSPSAIRSLRRIAHDESLHPVSRSDLASALATHELDVGTSANRRSKALLDHAARNPTDNSDAQIEWLASSGKSATAEELRALAVEQPGSQGAIGPPRYNFEAAAWHAYSNGRFREATDHAALWAQDEPYAMTPVNLLSFTSGLQGAYTDTIRWAEHGMRLAPRDPIPILNLSTALLESGDIERSIDTFTALTQIVESRRGQSVVSVVAPSYFCLAGCLAMRTAMPEQGERYFARATSLARSSRGITADAQRIQVIRDRERTIHKAARSGSTTRQRNVAGPIARSTIARAKQIIRSQGEPTKLSAPIRVARVDNPTESRNTADVFSGDESVVPVHPQAPDGDGGTTSLNARKPRPKERG